MSELENENVQEQNVVSGSDPETTPSPEASHEHHHEHSHHHHHSHHSHHSHHHSSTGDAAQSSHAETENDEDGHEHHHHHHHHHRHNRRTRIRNALYYMLSLFLAANLFLLSIFVVIYLTVFSSDHIIKVMRSDGYSTMVSSELQSRMEDLCDASGFDKEFASRFVRNYNVKKAVEDYVTSFYTSSDTLVETTGFKQQLYDSIDEYIEEKGITVSDETRKNISYFVDEAAEIYVDQISIPFFSNIANYIENTRVTMNVVLGFLAFMTLVIVGIIWFTNTYKHRRYRFLFIGTAGAALSSAILPTVVLLSGKIKKINLSTRSIYNLFVDYFSSIFYDMYICTGVLLFASAIFLYLYIRHRNHVLRS